MIEFFNQTDSEYISNKLYEFITIVAHEVRNSVFFFEKEEMQ